MRNRKVMNLFVGEILRNFCLVFRKLTNKIREHLRNKNDFLQNSAILIFGDIVATLFEFLW
jgi:hypothetical protein